MDKNKESAFPHSYDEYNGPDKYTVYQSGMTLRDYFAAKAMQSFLIDVGLYNSSEVAKRAYKCADAMLKYRNNEQGNDSSAD